jgi:hypothetical protein
MGGNLPECRYRGGSPCVYEEEGRCVRYRDQTMTEDDAVRVRGVYGWDRWWDSDVMGVFREG